MKRKLQLNELRSLIRKRLAEGIAAELRAKYGIQNTSDASMLDDLEKSVPAKHFRWAAKQWWERHEPLGEVIGMVREFEREKTNLANKDLNSYKSLGELRDAIEALGATKRTEKVSKDDRVVVPTQFNERFKIVLPKTASAACKYGRNTRWCISATRSENMFDEYAEDDTLFYIVEDEAREEKDPLRKVAVVVPRPNSRPRIYGPDADQIGVSHPQELEIAREDYDSRYDDVPPETMHAFNALDDRMEINDAIVAWYPHGLEIMRRILRDAAKQPKTLQSTLVFEKDSKVLTRLAQTRTLEKLLVMNPNVPLAALEILWKNNPPGSFVRARCGGHPNAPPWMTIKAGEEARLSDPNIDSYDLGFLVTTYLYYWSEHPEWAETTRSLLNIAMRTNQFHAMIELVFPLQIGKKTYPGLVSIDPELPFELAKKFPRARVDREGAAAPDAHLAAVIASNMDINDARVIDICMHDAETAKSSLPVLIKRALETRNFELLDVLGDRARALDAESLWRISLLSTIQSFFSKKGLEERQPALLLYFRTRGMTFDENDLPKGWTLDTFKQRFQELDLWKNKK